MALRGRAISSFEALIAEALIAEALVVEALIAEALIAEALIAEALIAEALRLCRHAGLQHTSCRAGGLGVQALCSC